MRRNDKLKYEFLPSALEITETPPSKLAGLAVYILVTFIVVALTWSYFGQIDIIASGRGKISPEGSIKIVQSPIAGKLTAIATSEGQEVKEGSLIFTLDQSVSRYDLNSAEKALSIANLEKAILKSLTQGKDTDEIINAAHVPSEIKEDLKSFADSRSSAYNSQKNFASLSVNQAREQAALITTQFEKSVDELEVKKEDHKKLYESYVKANGIEKAALQSQLNAAQEDIQSSESLMHNLRDKLSQVTASVSQAQNSLFTLKNNNKTSTWGSIIEQDKKILELESLVNKTKEVNASHLIYAPTSGRLMTLSNNTIGGVVAAGQQLATIVPQDATLTIETLIPNQDIGFITIGQDVAIKVDTYSFQRYGTLPGRVTSISPDASIDEVSGVSTYKIGVTIDGDKSSKDQEIKLLPGMSVTSEIKTGKRRIISFFLDPLIAGLEDSFKVR